MNGMRHRIVVAIAILSIWVTLGVTADGQTATRFMGSVTAIVGNNLTVKTTQGEERQFQVSSTAEVKRIEPGQTNLAAAVAMPLSDIANGDRVLVWFDASATSGAAQALRVVAIKAADLAKKQQREAAEWQEHGVGGLVKSVDAASGVIVITSGAGATAKTIIIHTDKSTILKRYAETSVNYEAAQPASFSAIQAGDQLMARGAKNADNVAAEEVVSGSFRNLSGLIASLDPTQQTFVIKDLATKKQFTVRIPNDAQMRQLPERAAQMIAARLKGDAAGTTSQQGGNASGRPAPGDNAAGGSPRSAGGSQGADSAAGSGQRGAWPQRNGGNSVNSNDPQQMLAHAPAIHFADLQKGEAVMLVTSPGDSQVTAITLLAGVEPLLEAPASQDLLANWSMGSGSSEGGESAP